MDDNKIKNNDPWLKMSLFGYENYLLYVCMLREGSDSVTSFTAPQEGVLHPHYFFTPNESSGLIK